MIKIIHKKIKEWDYYILHNTFKIPFLYLSLNIFIKNVNFLQRYLGVGK